MKKIAEWINPIPTLPWQGEGVKFHKDENRLSMLDLIGCKNGGIQDRTIFLLNCFINYSYALFNIVATPLNNAQPWRLFLLHYPHEMERPCL